MARVEQADYPYVEDSHGLFFEEVEYGEEYELISGSGRLIGCQVSPNAIGLVDKRDPKFRLCAVLKSDGTLLLDFYTRAINRNTERVHPDLFAARFVRFALVNFADQGVEISCLAGNWTTGSTNYNAFRRVYDQTGDMNLAAQSTWTGRLAAQHGFTNLTEVVKGRTYLGITIVSAFFEKPAVPGRA